VRLTTSACTREGVREARIDIEMVESFMVGFEE